METVNHVLDYTKLSGNVRAGGVENVIPRARFIPTSPKISRTDERARVNLMELIEEAVEGCWVGFRARMPNPRADGIGTFYSPPSDGFSGLAVETVVDIGFRPEVGTSTPLDARVPHVFW